jgi:hypothetical protein
MAEGKDRRQFHGLRKIIDEAPLPQRKALIALARTSSPDRLKDTEHSLFLLMQRMLDGKKSKDGSEHAQISCLQLPKKLEEKLLEVNLWTLGQLCSYRETDMADLEFTSREITKIRAQLSELGLTFTGEVGPFDGPEP